MSTVEQSVARLVAVEDLGASRVAVVDNSPHGALAVGISRGKPFAVSNRCRHLFASLGNGQVTDDGGLQCPWHAARYDAWQDGAGAPGRVQATGGRGEGDDRRTIAEEVPGRGARRRYLADRRAELLGLGVVGAVFKRAAVAGRCRGGALALTERGLQPFRSASAA